MNPDSTVATQWILLSNTQHRGTALDVRSLFQPSHFFRGPFASCGSSFPPPGIALPVRIRFNLKRSLSRARWSRRFVCFQFYRTYSLDLSCNVAHQSVPGRNQRLACNCYGSPAGSNLDGRVWMAVVQPRLRLMPMAFHTSVTSAAFNVPGTFVTCGSMVQSGKPSQPVSRAMVLRHVYRNQWRRECEHRLHQSRAKRDARKQYRWNPGSRADGR